MAQATDGSWYAYVVNQIAIENYGDYNLIFNADIGAQNGGNDDTINDTDARTIYANATDFLAGFKEINTNDGATSQAGCHGTCIAGLNNDADALNNWPFIQSYDISNKDVTITYGSGMSVGFTVLVIILDLPLPTLRNAKNQGVRS